jgi:hypothetical protein
LEDVVDKKLPSTGVNFLGHDSETARFVAVQ